MDGITSSRSAGIDRNQLVVPGDGLLHPAPLTAVLVLLLNDHVLKAAIPGLVTGKLSDFAGLAFFPLLLQAVWELCGAVGGRGLRRSRGVLVASVILTMFVFSSIKLVPSFANLYQAGFGALAWPLWATLDWLEGHRVSDLGRVAVAVDHSDLIALPAALLGLLIQRHRTRGDSSS